jgi:cellulose synthase/poly-beta-1,6-N-acetylglucosamine synthase-like glycosyltransferase
MQETVQAILQWVNASVIAYYGLVSVLYTILGVRSIVSVVHRKKNFRTINGLVVGDTERTVPIAVVMPVFNQQDRIVGAVQSLLALNYPHLEVLVVNDGSRDETLKTLKEAFNLQPVFQIYRPIISTLHPASGFYKNFRMPALTVIDKKHSGKVDSLNVGVNIAQSPYFCSVDVDTLLEKNALLNLLRPVVETPDHVVACGGIMGIVSAQEVDHLRLIERDLPSRITLRLQVITYLKRCLFGRMSWGHLSSFIGMSGECVLFQRKLVQKIGGYVVSNAIPNMELLLRLHHIRGDQRQPFRMIFTPVLVGWRILPERPRNVLEEEVKRQRGIIDTLLKFKGMAFNPRYGRMGLITLPLLLFTETVGPFFETFGYITIAVALGFGWVAMPVVLFFVFLAVVYSSFLSVGSVAAEAILYQGYSLRATAQLAVYAVVESLGYRQMIDWCRLWAVVRCHSARGS